MFNVRQSPPPEEEAVQRTAGQDFVKRIRPIGCVLFILLAVMVAAICLTSGKDPIPGYEPPETMEYYSEDLDALIQELETAVFPALEEYDMSARISDDGTKVVITIDDADFVVGRSAVLQYFDQSLVTFERGG